MKKVLAILAAMAATPTLAQSPGTDMPCASIAEVDAALTQVYGEVVIFSGSTLPVGPVMSRLGEGGELRLYVGDSTWTVVVVMPNRMACLAVAGENVNFGPFEAVPQGELN